MKKFLLILFLFSFVPRVAQATFPTIAATNSGNSAAQVTSHTINLPASIANGDLLIGVFVADLDAGSLATVTWPSGWTQLDADTGAGATDLRGEFRFKRADGTEGATMTITTSGNARGSAHATYRITGHHTTSDPEGLGTDGGDAARIDGPSLTASWGAEDNLWITGGGYELASTTITAFPTSYTLSNVQDRWNDANGQGVAIAARELNTATTNPAVFTPGTTSVSVGFTIVIRPAAVGGGTQRRASPLFFQ